MRTYQSWQKKQRGAYLVILAVMLGVLIAFGALALDLGRLFVLRSQMQNAADAAALAAAAELDSRPGARSRAETAARHVLTHDSPFSQVNELLGEHLSLSFFCAIGSQMDPAQSEVNEFCSNGYVDGRSTAGNNRETHYVEVALTPAEGSDAYSIALWFLPVLDLFMQNVSSRAFLSARATAGRNFFMCNYPPVMLCNPFESTGQDFNDVMNRGEQIQLKQQGGNFWAPGNFSFLQPDAGSGGGAPDVAEYLADEGRTGCTPPIVTTETGGMTNKTAAGLNTRFDLYTNPAPFNRPDAPDTFPPAPNVIDFPRDATWRPSDNRFGNADWDRDAYFTEYHDWQSHGRPGNWMNMTRWEVYNWELSEHKLPSRQPLVPPESTDTAYEGYPDPAHVNTSDNSVPQSVPGRRLMHVAVVNCQAHGLTGRATIPLIQPEGFAELFITEKVMGPPDANILVEYVDWADETNEDYHVDVQLYE